MKYISTAISVASLALTNNICGQEHSTAAPPNQPVLMSNLPEIETQAVTRHVRASIAVQLYWPAREDSNL